MGVIGVMSAVKTDGKRLVKNFRYFRLLNKDTKI